MQTYPWVNFDDPHPWRCIGAARVHSCQMTWPAAPARTDVEIGCAHKNNMLETCSSVPALALNNMCAVTREFSCVTRVYLPEKKARAQSATAVDHPTIGHTGGGSLAAGTADELQNSFLWSSWRADVHSPGPAGVCGGGCCWETPVCDGHSRGLLVRHGVLVMQRQQHAWNKNAHANTYNVRTRDQRKQTHTHAHTVHARTDLALAVLAEVGDCGSPSS